MQKQIAENQEEVTVVVNYARKDTKERMIQTGICYLRAGESTGSMCITPGFERMEYVLLHTNGEDCQLFKLRQKGAFQIWTKETLEKYGFTPSHAEYYIVLKFNNKALSNLKLQDGLKAKINSYYASIRQLSDIVDYNNQTDNNQ